MSVDLTNFSFVCTNLTKNNITPDTAIPEQFLHVVDVFSEVGEQACVLHVVPRLENRK